MVEIVKKKISFSKETLDWAEKAVEDNLFPGIRSLSGLCEKALHELRKKTEDKKKIAG